MPPTCLDGNNAVTDSFRREGTVINADVAAVTEVE